MPPPPPEKQKKRKKKKEKGSNEKSNNFVKRLNITVVTKLPSQRYGSFVLLPTYVIITNIRKMKKKRKRKKDEGKS